MRSVILYNNKGICNLFYKCPCRNMSQNKYSYLQNDVLEDNFSGIDPVGVIYPDKYKEGGNYQEYSGSSVRRRMNSYLYSMI